jgi:CRP-like cAMP-binding protein
VTSQSQVSSRVPAALQIFRDLSGPISYPARSEIIPQGTNPQSVFLIEQGLVALRYIGIEAQEPIIAIRSAGWFLGAGCVMVRSSVQTSIDTLSSCVLRHISAKAFLDAITQDIKASHYIAEMLAAEAYDEISEHCAARLTSRQRLEQFLWKLATNSTASQAGPRVHLPLTMEQLASLLSISPQWLNQLLHKLEAEGVLQRLRGVILIPDASRLWHERNGLVIPSALTEST